jgi:hypothetical protein
MKKTMMVLLFASVTMISFGQQKITGFGRMQLGMSVNELTELSEAKLVGDDEYFNKVYENTTKNVYEAKLDTISRSSSFTTRTNKVRVFQVGQIKLTDNITLKDVTLKFFNDKLYSIQIKDDQIDDLITTKYGEGKAQTETKDHTFQNGYGAKFVKTDLKKEITWNTNDPQTSCYYITNYWYNDNGKLLHYEYANLSNNTIEKIVNNENDLVKVRIEKREEDKKKSLVSGF